MKLAQTRETATMSIHAGDREGTSDHNEAVIRASEPIPRVRTSIVKSVQAGFRIALARLRFFLLLGGVFLIVAAWPTLRNLWDKWTGPVSLDAGISPDMEYWCPMCPGVSSDWPGKCPVCHMALVVRQKGEMTPLPDGVVARMQFPPYRVQLAGIHTSAIDYRPLVRETIVAGLVEATAKMPDDLTRLSLTGDVFERDIGLFKVGQEMEATSEAFPGRPFAARVDWLATQMASGTRKLALRLQIDNPQKELRAGMFVTARVRVPLASLPKSRESALAEWRERTTVSLAVASLTTAYGMVPAVGLDSLVHGAVQQAAVRQGLVLAVPESAVIDTGTRKIAFLEQSPGLFDAVEVQVGQRCGDYYPVVAGVTPGQMVVTAGAFLLDAETRLNPAAAASYFGAGSRGGTASATPTAPASGLSTEDLRLVKRQKICPVMGEPLGSMGTPYRIVIEGRTVFLCCEGCAPTLKKNPGKYLGKLPK